MAEICGGNELSLAERCREPTAFPMRDCSAKTCDPAVFDSDGFT